MTEKKLTTNQKLDLILDRLAELEARDQAAKEKGDIATPTDEELAEIAALRAAAAEQASRDEAAHAALNEEVVFQVSALLSWDAKPGEGMEWYAPDDFDVEAHCAANDIDNLIDGDGNPVKIEGSWFRTERITATALQKAGLGTIAE